MGVQLEVTYITFRVFEHVQRSGLERNLPRREEVGMSKQANRSEATTRRSELVVGA